LEEISRDGQVPSHWAGVIAREHMINFISDAFTGKVEPNKP
jgi:hypothetical protein